MRNDMPNAVRQKRTIQKSSTGLRNAQFFGPQNLLLGGMVLNCPRSATATILQHRFFMGQNVQGVVIRKLPLVHIGDQWQFSYNH